MLAFDSGKMKDFAKAIAKDAPLHYECSETVASRMTQPNQCKAATQAARVQKLKWRCYEFSKKSQESVLGSVLVNPEISHHG